MPMASARVRASAIATWILPWKVIAGRVEMWRKAASSPDPLDAREPRELARDPRGRHIVWKHFAATISAECGLGKELDLEAGDRKVPGVGSRVPKVRQRVRI